MTAPRPAPSAMPKPDLAGAARHGIGHGGVEADAGNRQGEDRKGAAQPRKDDLLVDRLIDVGGLGPQVRDRHATVGLVHDLANSPA